MGDFEHTVNLFTRWFADYETVQANKNRYRDTLQTYKLMFEDSEEESECKRDAKNLYLKLVILENDVLTVVWEEVMERFDKTSKKLQTSGSDIFEGLKVQIYLLRNYEKIQPTGLHTMNQ
ncbi:Hypothetical predicted protein [Octopus vulgaris]|uniref:Uncharacterized protein n=1 Tax=Octopus vulgaris TaxID=6645 RepID=A0AA36F8I5_OCTVU|nr:Hypothetical predicted protein [Octopus vulgaris]